MNIASSGLLTVSLCAFALSGACKGESPKPTPAANPPAPATDPAASPVSPPPADAPIAAEAAPCRDLTPLPTRHPAAERVVAIGDLHGDLAATRAVLRLAGAIDEKDRWIGGNLVVVQTGDILDRGDDEQAILDLLEALAGQARTAGGALHVLNGNHELMNAAGDLRYVTPGGLADFADVPDLDLDAPELARLDPSVRARAAAFLPGGPYARLLSGHNTVVLVGDTVFVHGGLLPEHVTRGIERINHEIRCWLRDGGDRPAVVADPDSPVWSRHYSMPPEDCPRLAATLRQLGARRMVVGHTTQRFGINPGCDGQVWRIDTGMAAHYGGPTQALEIRGDSVSVLSAAK